MVKLLMPQFIVMLMMMTTQFQYASSEQPPLFFPDEISIMIPPDYHPSLDQPQCPNPPSNNESSSSNLCTATVVDSSLPYLQLGSSSSSNEASASTYTAHHPSSPSPSSTEASTSTCTAHHPISCFFSSSSIESSTSISHHRIENKTSTYTPPGHHHINLGWCTAMLIGLLSVPYERVGKYAVPQLFQSSHIEFLIFVLAIVFALYASIGGILIDKLLLSETLSKYLSLFASANLVTSVSFYLAVLLPENCYYIPFILMSIVLILVLILRCAVAP